MLVRLQLALSSFPQCQWLKENVVWRSLFAVGSAILGRLLGAFWEGVQSKAAAKVILFLLHQKNLKKNSVPPFQVKEEYSSAKWSGILLFGQYLQEVFSKNNRPSQRCAASQAVHPRAVVTVVSVEDVPNARLQNKIGSLYRNIPSGVDIHDLPASCPASGYSVVALVACGEATLFSSKIPFH